MKLSELLDAGAEAYARFGDLDVAVVDNKVTGVDFGFMDVCVAEVQGKPIFTFMVLDNASETVQ